MRNSTKLLICIIIAFIASFSLAGTYGMQLQEMNPDTCRGAPYFWAYFSKYYFLVLSISLLFLIVNNAWAHRDIELKKIMDYILLAPTLGLIAYCTGAFLSFSFRDECSGLHSLIVIAFWIALFISVSIVSGCFLLCWFGGFKKLKSAFVGRKVKVNPIRTDTYYAVPELVVGPTQNEA